MRIRFNPFVYCTVGRRAELELGIAHKDPLLYQRMLDEIAEYVGLAANAGYAGWGHPEHHLQDRGFRGRQRPNPDGQVDRHAQQAHARHHLWLRRDRTQSVAHHRYEVNDTTPPGLRVRVQPSGVKSFRV